MSAPAAPATSAALVASFLLGTLPQEAWTHEAHLLVCLALLEAASDPAEALDQLRTAIQAHNARVGVAPGHGGYHETVTRYYVWAVEQARPIDEAELVTLPSCDRGAPLRHWSRDLLASDAARTGWVEPDLAPLT